MTPGTIDITMIVNGEEMTLAVEPRRLLVDVLREQLGLTGTHIGCEQGVCGACTVMVDQQTQRSCLILAPQADGCDIRTIEGLSGEDEEMHPVQRGFQQAHGLQCGFCTPGFVVTIKEFLEANPDPSEGEIRRSLTGNLCRCTGYVHIVDAVQRAAELMREGRADAAATAGTSAVEESP